MKSTYSNLGRIGIVILSVTWTLAAQANDHASDDKIAVAKATIAHAEQAGGPEAAPVEMAAARDKLALAEKANGKHDYKPAADLADRASIDAEVAEATATKVRSSKAAAEFDASLQTLRQEANRASQPAQ